MPRTCLAPLTYLVLCAVASSLFGCDSASVAEGECPLSTAGDCYFYQAFGEGGTLGAQGYVSLREGAPQGEVQPVQGVWQIERVGARVEVGTQVGSGVLSGTLRGSDLVVLLNPELPSGGVELIGTLDAGEITGVWVWDGTPEAPASGAFRASRVE